MSEAARPEWPLPPEVGEPSPPKQRRSWGKVSHPERYRRQRRDLLRAAVRLAGTKGYEGTRIADIVAEAGLSKSTFYEHFASKEDCFVELYRRTSAQMLESAVHTAEAAMELGPRRCLYQVVRAFVGYPQRNPRLAEVLRAELAVSHPAVRRQRAENVRGVIDFFTTLARRLDTPLEGADLELTATVLVLGVTDVLADLRRAPESLDERLASIADLGCRAFQLEDGP